MCHLLKYSLYLLQLTGSEFKSFLISVPGSLFWVRATTLFIQKAVLRRIFFSTSLSRRETPLPKMRIFSWTSLKEGSSILTSTSFRFPVSRIPLKSSRKLKSSTLTLKKTPSETSFRDTSLISVEVTSLVLSETVLER